jgi:hypothetical protein
MERLLKMLWHQYPRIRNVAVDELWDLGITCVRGRDWTNTRMKKKEVLGTKDAPSKFAVDLCTQCKELGVKDGDIIERILS